MDRDTREIVGVYVGNRSIEGVEGLWESLPELYTRWAVVYTDFWEAYRSIFAEIEHHPVGKESGQTNHIERFNRTLRQRISRLAIKTLFFSKKIENHVGAIWYFIHHYNAGIRAALTI